MAVSVQPVLMTPDLDRLRGFYTTLFGAVQIARVPEQGTMFYVGLQLGDSTLGLVADGGVDTAIPQRMLLSIGVEDVDNLLGQVERAGGRVLGPPNDMPWGQRVAHIQDPDGNAVNLTQPT